MTSIMATLPYPKRYPNPDNQHNQTFVCHNHMNDFHFTHRYALPDRGRRTTFFIIPTTLTSLPQKIPGVACMPKPTHRSYLPLGECTVSNKTRDFRHVQHASQRNLLCGSPMRKIRESLQVQKSPSQGLVNWCLCIQASASHDRWVLTGAHASYHNQHRASPRTKSAHLLSTIQLLSVAIFSPLSFTHTTRSHFNTF